MASAKRPKEVDKGEEVDFWSQIEKGKDDKAQPKEKCASKALKENETEPTMQEQDQLSKMSTRKDNQIDQAEMPVDDDTKLDLRNEAIEIKTATDKDIELVQAKPEDGTDISTDKDTQLGEKEKDAETDIDEKNIQTSQTRKTIES